MTTTIKRKKLLEILRKNRDKHLKVFEEAWKGYHEAVVDELEHALADARSGKQIFRQTRLVQPLNQTREYDAAIRMLELNTADEVSLEEREFNQLVMDRWSWAKQFSASTSAYVKSAGSINYLSALGE